MWQRLCLGIALAALAPEFLPAQASTGEIRGRTTSAGAALANVSVALECSQGATRAATLSLEDGRFWFPAVAVGSCMLHLTHPGHRPVVVGPVTVTIGGTTDLGRIAVPESPIPLEPILVSTHRLLLDPASTTSGENLPSSAFTPLPVERDYRSLLPLVAQVNRSYHGDEYNVQGATGLENAYFINGVNVTESMMGAHGIDLPYNFVQEVQVLNGGYEAEYSGALGAVVNVLVRSGQARPHLDLFGFYTADALTGEPRRGQGGLAVQGFDRYDAGLSIGGPLGERIRYFAAYDADVDRTEVDPGGFGPQDDQRTRHRFAGRLDWNAGPRLDLSATVFGDPAERRGVGNAEHGETIGTLLNLDPVLFRQETGGVGASLQAWARPDPRILVQLLTGWSSQRNHVSGETEQGRESLLIDRTTGSWSGGFGVNRQQSMQRISARASATWHSGAHTAKAGVDYDDGYIDAYSDLGPIGEIIKLGDTYAVLVATRGAQVRNRIPAIFIQDSWAPSDRLSVNAGLRWSAQYLIGPGDSVAQAFPAQWQPRLGIVWRPGAGERNRVFGSAGRFYQDLPLAGFSMAFSPWDNRFDFYHEDPRTAGAVRDSVHVFSDPDAPAAAPRRRGLRAEHTDELMLGYERLLASQTRIGVRGIYRTLRRALSTGVSPQTGMFVVGNPGFDSLSFLPRARRDYQALELTLRHRGDRGQDVLASYTLSRNYGNYAGLYDSDSRWPNPGNYLELQTLEQIPNSTGLLPNDRTHVFKLAASGPVWRKLTAGAVLSWQSGTPRTEYVVGSMYRNTFYRQRGTAPRTPSTWTTDLRLRYPVRAGTVILDVLDVASRRKVLLTDEVRFVSRDPLVANPLWGVPQAFQPPMSVRLGAELTLGATR